MLAKVDKTKLLLLIVSALSVLLVYINLRLFHERNNLIAETNTLNRLTLDDADQIRGYTCGILTLEKVEQFLNTPVSQSLTNYTRASDSNEILSVRHYDSCKYVSKTNSNIYAEFFIETYEDETAAADSFDSHLPLVAQPVEKPDFISDVDRIVYDAGVYYVLNNRKVIQVAASNGAPGESEQFAGELLKSISTAL